MIGSHKFTDVIFGITQKTDKVDKLLLKYLILKQLLACNGCFGVFTKIKKGSVTSFWCTFST